MKKNDVYLHGMILLTNSFLLKDSYPLPDTYGEIREKYILPGGETGTAATILSGFGCSVMLQGTFLGNHTYPDIIDFYKDKSVDLSGLFLDCSYNGLEDYVIIDKDTRTCFGTFGEFYTNGLKRWNDPKESDILASKVVGLDPWFGEATLKIVTICKNHHIPYITIDCPYDNEINKNCTVNILSNEFISSTYPGEDREELFRKYASHTNGLVIFTLGAKDILYGRKNSDGSIAFRHLKPYSVKVVSTLGAGDSFKAGCIYAVLQNKNDDDIVRFAAATAACACTAFPLPLHPPTLEQINLLLDKDQSSTI